jgi:DnaA family protein
MQTPVYNVTLRVASAVIGISRARRCRRSSLVLRALLMTIASPVKQLAFDFSLPTPADFDNFVVGRNGELVQRLRMPAAHSDECFVYIWGARGSGRTHLLKAAVASRRRAGARAIYAACTAETRLPQQFQEKAYIAVDDVGQLGETGQRDLFSLYNALRENGGALIAAGDVAPAQLGVRPDVQTRLGWGLVYEVHGLTDEEKAAALAERAFAKGFTLQADVSQYLLTHARRDMPALLSMLDALDRYSLEAKRPVTVPLLRELLAAHGQ